MLLSYACVLVMIAGLIIFVMSKTNPDSKEIGRAMLWLGMFWTLAIFAGHHVRWP